MASSHESSLPSSFGACKHVVYLTVHGMGQRDGKFAEHLHRLHQMSLQLQQQQQQKSSSVNNYDLKFHFLPVEWNKKLHSLVDDKVQKISLPTVPLMRHVNNNLIADTLYYFTEYHGRKIRQMVVETMDQVYGDFLARQGSGDSVVSVCLLAHSLGGIICGDILCDKKLYVKLPFKVDCLFLAGCSLSAALVMRGQDGIDTKQAAVFSSMPSVNVYNIYNRFDPFAYRLEPLMYPSIDDGDTLPDAVLIPSIQLPTSSSLAMVREEGSYIRRFGSVFSLSLFSSWMPSLSTSAVATESTGEQSPRPEHLSSPRRHGQKRPRSVVEQEDAEMDSELSHGTSTSVETKNDAGAFGLFASVRALFRRETVVTVDEHEVSNEDLPKHEKQTAHLPIRYDYELENQSVLLNINNEYVNGILAHFCYWFYPSFVNFLMEKALHHASNK